MKHFSLLALTLLPGLANAALYKCADAEGRTLYTDQKPAQAKSCAVVSRNSAAAPKKARAATPAPEGFPKISGETQKMRDNNRRTILEHELAAEQKHLESARRTNDAESIRLHESNIEALRKEMARAK